MARSFRPRKKTNSKGEAFYQIWGPNPKTGKDEYRETVKGPGDVAARAKKRVKELTAKAFGLTDFGKMETRTVADLVAAFLSRVEDRERWMEENQAWHVKRRSMTPATRVRYQSASKRILTHLGDITLIALELDDIQKMINATSRGEGYPLAALRDGESLATMLRWGAKHDWQVKPKLIALLDQLLLPKKSKREVIGTEDHYRAIFKVIYGPRRHKQSRMGYFIERALWTLLVSNGPRRGEIAAIMIENIDWVTGAVLVTHIVDASTGEIVKRAKTAAGQDRYLWFAKQTLDASQQILQMRGSPTKGLLFEPQMGTSIYGGMYAAHLLPVLKAADIPRSESKGVINFHSSRHRASSELNVRGVPLVERQAMLGWSKGRGDGGNGGNGGALTIADSLYSHVLPEHSKARDAAQAIVDHYMPDEITPVEEAMKLSEGSHTPWDPEKRRPYQREYMRKRRAAERAAKTD